MYSIPAPVKRLFDIFPLKTYPANNHGLLEDREQQHQNQHRLYIFTDSHGVSSSSSSSKDPSFNPQCLKWQAYLSFLNVSFCTIPSNNHASPSGALPFLIPASSSSSTSSTPVPVPSHKLKAWTEKNILNQTDPPTQHQTEQLSVYTSLLDDKIRKAWLYIFYLHPSNFPSAAKRLYVDSATSNSLVRAVLARQLQQAARDELLRDCAYVDEAVLIADADAAFFALATLLGEREWFDGGEEGNGNAPGLFDASVFAYTYLCLDEEGRMGMSYNPLAHAIRKYKGLERHAKRISEMYFS